MSGQQERVRAPHSSTCTHRTNATEAARRVSRAGVVAARGWKRDGAISVCRSNSRVSLLRAAGGCAGGADDARLGRRPFVFLEPSLRRWQGRVRQVPRAGANGCGIAQDTVPENGSACRPPTHLREVVDPRTEVSRLHRYQQSHLRCDLDFCGARQGRDVLQAGPARCDLGEPVSGHADRRQGNVPQAAGVVAGRPARSHVGSAPARESIRPCRGCRGAGCCRGCCGRRGPPRRRVGSRRTARRRCRDSDAGRRAGGAGRRRP